MQQPPSWNMQRALWGKRDDHGHIHPLPDHCIDVAVVLRALLEIPHLARQMSGLDSSAKDRLAVVAFLHDFGKCNRGFQAKADPNATATAGHVLEAVALLFQDLHGLWPPACAWRALITELSQWFVSEEQACQMLLASISHHGRPVSLLDYQASGVGRAAQKWWSAANGYKPMAALDLLANSARQAFPNAFRHDVPPMDATAAFQQRFAGLVMLADWIGSDTQFFPYRRCEDEDRLALARAAAERALHAIGLRTPQPRTPRAFREVFGFAPTPLQAALAGTITPCEETRLLLAESDTGSGKTEAALAWFLRLYAEGRVDGLYFALPTRVAAKELYGRVLRAVQAAFEPDQSPGPVLLAAPGYVKVDGRAASHILTDPSGTLWDDKDPSAWRERLWSAERPKRFLAAPVAVGTIDQALLSVLQVKHSLMRSVCLDRHLLVVDEVHASDPYMREVLCALLRTHTGRGGWALLLSATLGEAASAKYLHREMVPLEQATARPYPLLSARTQTWPMSAARERQIHVTLSATLTNDAALVPALIDALADGARVLVVCNTVARANALFRLVESRLQTERPGLLPALFAVRGVCCPHHGRFAREDRELLDAAVTAQLGKNSPAGARLLIGTQTLEQSLDIDADWLVTDLAPMDVLIQRFGRLHRHAGRMRPARFEQPKATVRVPAKPLTEYLCQDGALRAPAGLGNVYADGCTLARTWEELQRLQRCPILTLPREARQRIECTTHPQALATLPDAWRKHSQYLFANVQAEVIQALRSVMDDKPFGDLHYPDKSERVLTRLGHPTYDIPLEKPVPSPFGVDIARVAIPAHWLPDSALSALPNTLHAEPTAEGFRFVLGTQAFRYSRLGLEKDDA